jgi:putative transposase
MFRHTVHEYVRHYHAEQNHQALENKLIQPVESLCKAKGDIECRERLGGLLKSYSRKAA